MSPGSRLPALVVLMALLSCSVQAQEAWLVTYGPGAEVWERFGHNALWLRDPESGLDHAYSFGYFELDRPGFHLDFARGVMPYFGAAAPVEREFAFYRQRDRSIRAQRLNLDPDQVDELHRLLHEAVFPVPQYYDYDYFFANCSTRLRDLLDTVLDGRLRAQLRQRGARLDFRDHLRRLNERRPELHAGLLLLLGSVIDQPRSAWEEGFLPGELARWVGETRIDGRPLVTATREIHAADTHAPPRLPQGRWGLYALLGVTWALVIVLPPLLSGRRWRWWPWRLTAVAAGLAGMVIGLMWVATAHAATAGNWMLGLLHPGWWLLLLPFSRRTGGFLWWLLLLPALASATILAWPDGVQYRGELLLWLVPVIAALLWGARLHPRSWFQDSPRRSSRS